MNVVIGSGQLGPGWVRLQTVSFLPPPILPLPQILPFTPYLGFYETDADGVEFVQTEPCKSAKNYLKGTLTHTHKYCTNTRTNTRIPTHKHTHKYVGQWST